MELERIEISGFRGIRRLAVSFSDLTILIGENAWVKSSLLDALSIFLHPTGEFYEFIRPDFYIEHTLGNTQTHHIQIILRWAESFSGEHRARRYRQFNQVWHRNQAQGLRRLDVHFSAVHINNKIIITRDFLDENGQVIQIPQSEALVKELMRLHPIIRIQDASRLRDAKLPMDGDSTRLEKRLENTVKRLQQRPGHVNKGEIRSSLKAMRTLLEYYFSFQDDEYLSEQLLTPQHLQMQSDYVHPLEEVAQNTSNQSRLVLMGLLSTFIRARGPRQLKTNARPILIFEDPESRLHPIILNQAWRLIQLIPMQRIVTTNSGDLLAVVPLNSIRRLERGTSQTRMYQVPPNLLTKDQERRVSFHVRFHRPRALFARCWLFVEGETEIWLFNELARLQGYELAAEGVQLIEFAQSGLKPLIKLANALGIEWHLVVDGDMAGQKYAQSAAQFLNGKTEKQCITILPEQDIEHYLYLNGYEALFRHMGHVEDDEVMSMNKIISRALRSYAKPDSAIAIVEYSEQHPEVIPLLLRWIIQRVITMARGTH